jgi:hypothetical protein
MVFFNRKTKSLKKANSGEPEDAKPPVQAFMLKAGKRGCRGTEWL